MWDNILAAMTDRRDDDVQMLDTSIVRAPRYARCVRECESNCTGRSRGGLTTKIHAVVDAKGLPLRLALSAGQDHDSLLATRYDKLAANVLASIKLAAIRLWRGVYEPTSQCKLACGSCCGRA